jgi:hypothetical protein
LDPSLRRRCAIVLDGGLSPGLAANAAAVLAASVGRSHPEIIGPDVADASGGVHPGITTIPFPILRADAGQLSRLAVLAREAGLGLCAFTELAQGCRSYDEYAARMGATSAPGLSYVGLSLFGDGPAVRRLTGGLALYR